MSYSKKYGKADEIVSSIFTVLFILGCGLLFFLMVRSDNNSSTSNEQPSQVQESTPSAKSCNYEGCQDDEIESAQYEDYELEQQGAYSDDGTVSQSYWYCWDSGDPSPHHLGYKVNGDHYCTNGELREAGFAGY